MIRKFAYPLAKFIDYSSNNRVKEAIKILDFGEKATRQQLLDFRLSALQSLITHAYANVPYYRNLFQEHGLTPRDFSSLEDIKKIPILTKDDIREAGSDLRSNMISSMDHSLSGTGGTTGEPIITYIDRRARALGTYAAQRGQIWMGWKPGIPIIKLFGGSLGYPINKRFKERLRDYALCEKFLSAYNLSSSNIGDYLKVIDENSPCIIKGYASALYNLALFAEAKNYKPNNVISLFATSEFLPEQWVIKISEVFNAPVKFYYGCGEINSLGFQTNQLGPYIVPDEHVIIESGQTKDDNRISCDNSLLLTSLFNYAQPLIRFQVGDVGTVNPPGKYHFKRSTITNLIGRTSDMFVRSDGSFVSSILPATIIMNRKIKVNKYQFIQTKINSIEFLYEPVDSDISENEKQEIKDIIRLYISKDIKIVFIKTTQFELSMNNKMRVVISRI